MRTAIYTHIITCVALMITGCHNPRPSRHHNEPPPPRYDSLDHLTRADDQLSKLIAEIRQLLQEIESIQDTRTRAAVAKDFYYAMRSQLIGIGASTTEAEVRTHLLSKIDKATVSGLKGTNALSTGITIITLASVISNELNMAGLKREQYRDLEIEVDYMRQEVIPIILMSHESLLIAIDDATQRQKVLSGLDAEWSNISHELQRLNDELDQIKNRLSQYTNE